MKFVNAKKPSEYGDALHANQLKQARLKAQLALLEEEETDLVNFLRKFSHNETFAFTSARGKQKVVKFSSFERRILNQEKAKQLLVNAGLKVPFKKALIQSAVVLYYTE